MSFAMNFKKFLVIVLAGVALTACATQKKSTGQMQSDVYTGTDTTFQMNSLSDNTIYHWRIKAIDIAGNEIYNNNGMFTFIIQTTEQKENITLSAPYPNPFPLLTSSVQNTRLKIVLNVFWVLMVKVELLVLLVMWVVGVLNTQNI